MVALGLLRGKIVDHSIFHGPVNVGLGVGEDRESVGADGGRISLCLSSPVRMLLRDE